MQKSIVCICIGNLVSVSFYFHIYIFKFICIGYLLVLGWIGDYIMLLKLFYTNKNECLNKYCNYLSMFEKFALKIIDSLNFLQSGD